MNWDTYYKHAANIEEREIEGELILVHQDTEEIYHLSQVGSAVWGLFSEPMPSKEVLMLLQRAFPEISTDTLQYDVKKLIQKLKLKGLIRTA